MAQQQRAPFSDSELKRFVADPDFTPEDLKLLSQAETQRLQRLQRSDSLMGHASDIVTGIGKGAAETAFDLGSLVHKTPVIGQITDKLSSLIGPKGYYPGADPSKAFSTTPPELESTNAYQKGGKVAEQVGEFLLPAGPARLEAVKSLVRLIPDAASPRAMALANKVLAHVGRVVGEAGSAGAVSAVHGDENPERPAEIAGGSTAAFEALGPMVRGLLKTKLGGEIAPMLAAISAMHLAGGMSELGLGAGLGAYGIMKRTASEALENPKVQAQVGKVITAGGTKAGELAAGAESESRVPKRRRLQEALGR